MNNLAHNMKNIVKNSSISQTQLAEKFGISSSRFNQYLNNRREPDINFILKFCDFFDITPNDLLYYNNPKPTSYHPQNRIREIRKEKGLTQIELAQFLGVSQTAIYKLETGASDLDTKWMEKISRALNVKPYELLPLKWQPSEDDILCKYLKKIIDYLSQIK